MIEDRFAAGGPEWEKVGVQFVDDVAPYEFMKLRLLNASHLAISGPARLMDFTYISTRRWATTHCAAICAR